MATALLILLCLFLLGLLWLRNVWRRDPMRILRFLFRMPGAPKKETSRERKSSGPFRRKRDNTSAHSHRRSDEPIIPKEYAVDVEFTEVKEYSSDRFSASGEKMESYRESQVSDVEWEEIK